MFLSDQQKATMARSADIKLLDLAANAIKEWDDVVSIRGEYTAKFLQESGLSDFPLLPNVQQPPLRFRPQNKREPMIHFDSNGKPVPPKRPLNPFSIYTDDYYAQVTKDNPDAKPTEIPGIIAQNWEEVDQLTKEYYDARFREAKEMYKQDMKLFESKYGRLLRQDGPSFLSRR